MKIEVCGKPEFKRFYIVNSQKRYWNGSGWTKNFRQAHLWADWHAASYQYRHLEDAMQKGKKERKYQGVIDVTVFSNTSYTPEQLQVYLAKAIAIVLDHEAHGTGPVPDSMVRVDINWEKLNEVTQPETRQESK